MRHIDLVGQRFNKLTVLSKTHIKKGHFLWFCKCDCGKETYVHPSNLKNNHTKSCGCYRKAWATVSGKHFKKHGLYKDPIYQSWKGIFSRLKKAKSQKKYHHYLEGKIKICKRWHKLENFIEDMSKTWFHGAQIDRINNDDDYKPSNCRWATRKQQMNNTNHNVILTFKNKTQNATQWGEELGMSPELIRNRVRKGWSVKRSLTPLQRNK